MSLDCKQVQSQNINNAVMSTSWLCNGHQRPLNFTKHSHNHKVRREKRREKVMVLSH